MPIVIIDPLNIGAFDEDPDSDTARAGGQKINNSFAAIKAAVDPIEAGATADQTGAEIKALYEAEADTNPFDDAAVTKLAGIEAGAQVNVALASQAEAEAGTENTKTMTALRVAQALGTLPAGMPFVQGPGQGTGNAITKTLAPTGGDFATWAEVMDYISGNVFDNVSMRISVQPGTYTVGVGATSHWNLYGSGISYLEFVGTNAATCIFNVNAGGTALYLYDGYCSFAGLTINNAVAVPSYEIFVSISGGHLNYHGCIFNNWFSALNIDAGDFSIGGSTIINALTGCYGIYPIGGTGLLYGLTINGINDTPYGINASKCFIINDGALTITNCDVGIFIEDGARVLLYTAPTMTSNVTNYNVPLNVMQGDGSYITNGGMSFATAAQGALADGAVQKSLYDANTVLAANADNTPLAVTVVAQTLLGRITAGNIAALTAAQVRTLLNVEDGATNDQTAAEILAALLIVDGTGSLLDADKLDGNEATAFATAAQGTAADAAKAKTDWLTVTQAVDLDAIETRVNSLDAAVVLRGSWDASAGTFPGGGTAQAGDSYIISVAGTVDSVVFVLGDRIVAILDNASTTTYAANWFKLDYTDAVLSVNGATGAVMVATAAQGALADTSIQDSDYSAAEGLQQKVSAGVYTTIKTNLAAAVDPTVNDDSGDGYGVYSPWVNTTASPRKIFICTNPAVGAAVWKPVGAGGTSALYKIANYTAVAGDVVFVNSTGGIFTITLPATPADRDYVGVFDCAAICETNNVTIDRNGSTIMGVAENYVIDVDSGRWEFTYDAAGTTWRPAPVAPQTGLNQTQVDARVVAVASGIKTKWIPIDDMKDGGSGAPAAAAMYGSAGANGQLRGRAFDPSTDERLWFSWVVPDNYLSSAGISFIPYWAPTTTNTSGDVQWELRGLNLSDGDAIDQAVSGNSCISQDTPNGTVNDLHKGPEALRKYLSTFTPGNIVSFLAMRRAATPDDYTGDAALFGFLLKWTTNNPSEV